MAKKILLIEKQRIVDEVVALKGKKKMPEACKEVGINVNSYWQYRRDLKRAGMLQKKQDGKTNKEVKVSDKEKELFEQPDVCKVKILLQDATFVLQKGSFSFKDGNLEFEGKGIIGIDDK